MPGQVTLRTRYKCWATDWFDLLWQSLAEMSTLVERCGWTIVETLPGAMYAVAMERV
jgi:hypothetical protein